MRGLYAICDVETLRARGVDVVAFAEAILLARPCALQLRAKRTPDEKHLTLLRELAPLCRAAGVPLVCNDRPDLAALAGCDAVHVGQTDTPCEAVRRSHPGLEVGISTHTMRELEEALASRPAYVAYGPIFPTTTKRDASPAVGLAGLVEAFRAAREAEIPLVAIGGIRLEAAADLAAHASALAVISDLLGDTPHDAVTVTARAAAFARVMGPA